MNYARIENGIVAEIILPFDGFTLEDRFHADIVAKCVECADGAVEPGWSYSGSEFTPPVPLVPEPASVPAAISRLQFFQQAAVINKITQQEALAAVRSGTVPAAIQAVIDEQPEDQQFTHEMLISGAQNFERSHSLIDAIAAALEIDMDEFFRAAALL